MEPGRDTSPLNKPHDSSREIEVTSKCLENHSYQLKVKNDHFIFIPAYITLLVKSLSKLDLKEESVRIAGTLIFRFLLEGLPEEVVEDISNGINYRLNEEPRSLNKDSEGINIKESKKPFHMLTITYRFVEDITFLPKLDLAPFDSMKIQLKFELTSKNIGAIKYRFNLHKCDHDRSNLVFKKNADQLAQYNICTPLNNVTIIPESKKDMDEFTQSYKITTKKTRWWKMLTKSNNANLINSEAQAKKPSLYDYYPIFNVDIGVYRQPLHMIVTTIGPLFILQILLLAIYLQGDDIGGKIGNIATLLLAIVAFIPSVRAEIPSLSYLLFTDYLIYSAILQSLIGMLEAVVYSYHQEKWVTRSFFIVSACFPALFAIIIIWRCIKYLENRSFWDRVPMSVQMQGDQFKLGEWHNRELVIDPKLVENYFFEPKQEHLALNK